MPCSCTYITAVQHEPLAPHHASQHDRHPPLVQVPHLGQHRYAHRPPALTPALDLLLPFLAGTILVLSGWTCTHPRAPAWGWPVLLALGLAITLLLALWTTHATYPGEDANPIWGRWARRGYRLGGPHCH
jgi:hypothetical protein